jgi:uncharacterized membrane protein
MKYKIPSREEMIKRVSKAPRSKVRDAINEVRRREETISQIDFLLSGIAIGIISSIMIQSLFPPQHLYIFVISFFGFVIFTLYFIRKKIKMQKWIDYWLEIFFIGDTEHEKRKSKRAKKSK